jgi:hypothetical protein
MTTILHFLVANWHVVLAILIGLYELLVRLIPTIGNYSLLKIIFDFLKWLSDRLNVQKK